MEFKPTKAMKIYLDFDGTVVEHEYPKIGRENFGWTEVVKKLLKAGHEIILNTYRADIGDGSLEKARNYINFHRGLDLQEPVSWCEAKIHPPQWNWERHHEEKIIFIDDQANNIPLKPTVMVFNSQMVDWDKLDKEFQKNKMYEAINT